MKRVRCAIYTRKSSEEGLAQAFNSLDAQREACAAYIVSQKHEGWVLVPDHYDDGGISGGTLERPGLKRLMTDIDEGRIDQIVVYKIDRLTRSLADFAKLVERLDRTGASFVSVTQSFNTATSMGRLTLNVLLSFAQFEREVTAERIRDKVAASKRKGLWMGGAVPLGYARDGRCLTIVEEGAVTIRKLYALYMEHGSVLQVKEKADALGLHNPGRNHAAKPFGAAHIHYILTNPTYAGLIRHREKTFAGHHPAIIAPDLWHEVQERLQSAGAFERGPRGHPPIHALLAGKIFDETGDRFTPSHSTRNGRRFTYYISSRLLKAGKLERSDPDRGWRLPGRALEQSLGDAIVRHLSASMPHLLVRDAAAADLATAQQILQVLRPPLGTDHLKPVLATIARADLGEGEAMIRLEQEQVARMVGLAPTLIETSCLRFSTPFAARKRGQETRLVIGAHQPARPDPILIRNIARAHSIYGELKRGRSFAEIARSEQLSVRRVMQFLDLAFLSPAIVRQILDGQQPLALTTKWFLTHSLPSDWTEQQRIVDAL